MDSNDVMEEIEADAIDLDFVAKARDGVGSYELDGELILTDQSTALVHVLNPVGAIVWRCLDGSGSLAAIIDDLADAFDTPVETVRDDVMEMVRTVGRLGLLDGVARFTYVAAPAQPAVEPGSPLPTFSLPGGDGGLVDTAALGRPAVLVNWSPQCGYCVKIAADLAEAKTGLDEQGIALVLVTTGDVDSNEALFDEHGLRTTTLYRGDIEIDEDPFAGMGTPVAYFVDGDGLVAAPLAYGAGEVPALVAGLAGGQDVARATADDHDHDHDHPHDEAAPTDGPKYVPVAGGVCGPGAGGAKSPRIWARTEAYAVGEYHIGVRADSGQTDQVLAEVFRAHRVGGGAKAPDNFSVVLGEGGSGTRGLNLLLQNSNVVVRSRSARRVVLGLANYLSPFVDPVAADEAGGTLLRTGAVGAVIGDAAVLLPTNAVLWLEQVQPRLHRAGIQLVDLPYSTIDTATTELVVPEPAVTIDWDRLAAVDDSTGRSELPAVAPGRYPLRVWGLWDAGTSDAFTPANAVVAAVSQVYAAGSLDRAVETVAELFRQVSPIPLPFRDADTFTAAVAERIAVLV